MRRVFSLHFGSREEVTSDTHHPRAQIGDLRFFRSPAYQDYFRHLDQKGGFYTERVGLFKRTTASS